MSENVTSGSVVTLYTGGARVIYQGDGSTTVFPVPFAVEASNGMQIFTAPLNDSGEAVVMDTSAWSYAASSVTITSAPAVDQKIIIMRTTPIKRRGTYAAGGALTAVSLNGDLDRLTMVAGDLDERIKLIPGVGVGRVLTGDEVDVVLSISGMIANGEILLRSGGWIASAANGSATLGVTNSGISVSGGLAVAGGATISGGSVSVVNGGGSFKLADSAVSAGASAGGNVGSAEIAPGRATISATSSGAGGIVGAGGVLKLNTSGAQLHYQTAGGEVRGVRADSTGTAVDGQLTVSGNFTASGAAAVTSELTVGSGATIGGNLTVSGGVVIGSDSAATQPWVLDQLGSSGFLQSYGGFTAWGEWSHSSSVNGIVTSVWGNRPNLTFSREFEVTVREGDEPDSSGRPGRTAVLSMDPADGYGEANITIKAGRYSETLQTGGYVCVSSGRATVGVDIGNEANTSRAGFLEVTEHSLVISHFFDDYNGWYGTPRQYDAAIILSGGRVIATTGSGTSLHSGNVVIDSDLGEYMTSSGARTVVSGILSSGKYVNSSGARAIAEDVMSSGGGVMPSGAIVSGAEIRTSVGDYLLTYTSSGGLMVSGGGAALQVSSGGILVSADDGNVGAEVGAFLSMTSNGGVTISGYNIATGPGHEYAVTVHGDGIVASGANGESVALSNGRINLEWNGEDLGASGGVSLGYGGIAMRYTDVFAGSHSLELNGSGLLLDGRPIYAAPTVVSSNATSVSIPVLSGGTHLTLTNPVQSLYIGELALTMHEDVIVFTLASGGVIDLPNCKLLGNDNRFEDGKSYMMAALYGAIVCVPYSEVQR